MKTARIAKMKEFLPKIGRLDVSANRELERRGDRHDVFFQGTIVVENQLQTIKVHLFSCDGSIPADRGKYYVCAKINEREDYSNFRSCPYCNGNSGVSSKRTQGLTAAAVADVVMPFLEKEGFKLALDKQYKPGGWWTFDFDAAYKQRDDLEAGSAPRFYMAWIEEFDCPVHGNFLWKEMECGL